MGLGQLDMHIQNKTGTLPQTKVQKLTQKGSDTYLLELGYKILLRKQRTKYLKL